MMDFLGMTEEELEEREREFRLLPQIGKSGDGMTMVLNHQEWVACRFAFSYLRNSLLGEQQDDNMQGLLIAARGALTGDNDAFANGVLALSRSALMQRDAEDEQMRHLAFTECSEVVSAAVEGMRSAQRMFEKMSADETDHRS